MPKIFDDREAIRRRILLNARELFARNGLAKTRAQDIALASGIAKGTLYRFFPSKEALFYQIFLQEQEDLFELLINREFPLILDFHGFESRDKVKAMILSFLKLQKSSPILGCIHNAEDRIKFNSFLGEKELVRFREDDLRRMGLLLKNIKENGLPISEKPPLVASLMRQLYLLYLNDPGEDPGWLFLLDAVVARLMP